MPVNVRPKPSIPDHEVLRKIGGGAYGEVWLARGVTGALRAVKVVWREDFEDERSFEREFEGILKFEPISRDHPGLVHILHVGRSKDETSFYYYVMELGDDVSEGRSINPIEYEPRTLRADNHQAKGVRWDTSDCVEIGIRLAEALDHLHENGLAHRDVKPSNIIFVNGKAKLADIGLVAARGQRTFVGTEGFVPPEGPGSARADIYSLGKVLYEIATGNDRMNFPELPEDVPGGTDRKRWLELNRVICEVCEPRLSKRRIATASDLVESLKRIQRGRKRRGGGMAVWVTSAVLIACSGWMSWELTKDSPTIRHLIARSHTPASTKAMGMVRIVSTPEGADLIDRNGTVIGTTQTPIMKAPVGKTISYTLRKRGYRDQEISEIIPESATGEPLVIRKELEVFNPPVAGEVWTDQLGTTFLPVQNHHESSTHVGRMAWQMALDAGKVPTDRHGFFNASENGQETELVLCQNHAAEAFCNWLRDTGIAAGFLTEDHEVRPILNNHFTDARIPESMWNKGWRPFRVKVRRIAYGNIIVRSSPTNAQLYLNGKPAGITDELGTQHKVKPGKVQILLLLDGYKPLSHELQIRENDNLSVSLSLEKNQSVVFGQPWENSLGMKLVPLVPDLMVSVWETRRSDFESFTSESGHSAPEAPLFGQTPDHPVTNVSRIDAEAFCKWLTQRERDGARITQIHEYRLPTDLEWSRMAGLDEPADLSPIERDLRKPARFLWGAGRFDPQRKFANLADDSLASTPDAPLNRTLPGYDDGFPFTAPVGRFPANRMGLFDLAGNVQEWVQDSYSNHGSEVLGVLRGGGWSTWQMDNLYIGSRNVQPPDFRDAFYGFRVVLGKSGEETEAQDEN